MKTWKKAKVHLLPAALKSGKAGQLAKVHNGKTLGILVSDYSGGGYWIKHSSSHKDGTFYETGEIYNPMPYHIYITTNEEIKEGEWRIIDNMVTNYSPLKNKEYGRKIIATTDPFLCSIISSEDEYNSLREKRNELRMLYEKSVTRNPYLSQIKEIDRKLSSWEKKPPSPSQDWIKEYVKNPVEDVEVKYEVIGGGRILDDEDEICDDFYLGVMVNSDNTINIRSVKSNWSIEELEPKLYKLLNDFDTKEYTTQYDSSGRISKRRMFPLNEWINENL